uniref:Protein osiris 2 n=1 Tax=Anopheles coluzzii TaxID=1518534 RepID=A0A6E8VI65_ANOCL
MHVRVKRSNWGGTWSGPVISVLAVLLLSCCVTPGLPEGIKLPDQTSGASNGRPQLPPQQPPAVGEERRQGKNLFDFIGLGTGGNVDPYLARTNAQCLNGELAECFKSQALQTFGEFFDKDQYQLTSDARLVRLPETQLRSLAQEGYEFVGESRHSDSEWELLYKYALRRLERFVKSTALEFHIPDDITEEGRYSARFIDEISDEIDVIEDKKAPLFTRHRLKKIFIPLLLILKVFKLKLLLFLPLVLGLASFKKLLGFLAIVVPGVIGYLKLFKPNQSCCTNDIFSGGYQPQYSPQGLGSIGYSPFKEYAGQNHYSRPDVGGYASPYGNYYRDSGRADLQGGNVKFGDDLAYQGYSEQYRSSGKDVKAES